MPLEYLTTMVAALGGAFGLTALAALTIRTEENLTLQVYSFLTYFVALFVLGLWVGIPDREAMVLGGAGAAVGVLVLVALRGIHRWEKRHTRLPEERRAHR